MRNLLAATMLAAVVVAVTPASAVSAADAPPPVVPAAPSPLPAAIEPLSAYVPQSSCDLVPRAGTAALVRLLTTTYPDTTAATTYACGSDGSTSEHYDGRAIDWMIPARTTTQLAEVNAFLTWLLAPDAAGNSAVMARRLGVMYVIYNSKIWGAYRASEGWRAYSCSGVTGCHQDHVHISLSWNGATGRTSFYSGQVATGTDYGPCRPADLNWAPPYAAARTSPCPSYPAVSAPSGASSTVTRLFTYSGAQVQQGSTGPVVSAVQSYLGVTADGDFGPVTKGAVVSFQTASALPATGVVDAATWRRLLTVATAPRVTAATPTVVQPDPTAGQPVTITGAAAPGSTVRVLYKNAATGGAYVALPTPAVAAASGAWQVSVTPRYSGTYYASIASGTQVQQTAPLPVNVTVKVTIDAIRDLGKDAAGRCVTRFLGGTYPFVDGAPVWIRNSAVSPAVPIGSGQVVAYGSSGRYDVRFSLTCGSSYRLFSLISGTGADGVRYTDNGVGADVAYTAGAATG